MYSAMTWSSDKLEKQSNGSKQKIRERRARCQGPDPDQSEEASRIAEEEPAREVKIESLEYNP